MLRYLVLLTGTAAVLLSLFGPIGTPLRLGAVQVVSLPVAATPVSAVVGLNEAADQRLLGADTFSISAQAAWPAPSVGGTYGLLGPADDFSVKLGTGLIRTPSGKERSALLSGVRARDVDVRVHATPDRVPEGGDQFVYVVLRRISETSSYRARIRFDPDRQAWLQFVKTVDGVSDLLGSEYRLASSNGAEGSGLWIRAVASGASPSSLALKAWSDGQVEPSHWEYTEKDSEPRLARPGGVGLQTYVSASTTNAPVVFGFADLRVSVAAPELLLEAATVQPTPTSAPEPTIAPTAPSSPRSAAQAWQELGPQVDSDWGRDTPATVRLLESFIAQFPDDANARDKLYAALIATARDAEAQDDAAGAEAALAQARALLPARGEAGFELVKLTPTPTPAPEPPNPQQILPTPKPRPAAQSPAVTTVQRAPVVVRAVNPPEPAPVVRPPAPTPTKVPFVAPNSGR